MELLGRTCPGCMKSFNSLDDVQFHLTVCERLCNHENCNSNCNKRNVEQIVHQSDSEQDENGLQLVANEGKISECDAVLGKM